MRNRCIGLILAMAVVLPICPVLLAQAPNQPKLTGGNPAPANAVRTKRDLSGVWRARNQPLDFTNPKGPGMGAGLSTNWFGEKRTGGGFGFLDSKSEQPSMLPWAAARYKAIREGSYEYLQPLKNVEPWINCLPSSMPWVYDHAQLEPFEIMQTPKKIVMLFSQDGHWRQIFLDGRKNPEGAPDTFMGYSTGKWDGNTLVVETIGINDMTWIDRLGHPHSDALRVEERIRRVAPDRLDIDFLFDDPKTYAKPWKGKKIFYSEDSDVVEVFACEDLWRQEYPEKVRKQIGETKGP